MITKSLTELSAGLKAGDFSSVELTQYYLDRIAKYDGGDNGLNAFITVTEEQALAGAKAADEKITAGSAGALTGIPMAHKDLFCTDGVRTSCASKMLDNFIAPYNATVVEKLNAAGMPMLGKTNMDEFAMGSSN
ncbi:MAG: amidase, partial [Cocleimonas sp.]